MAINAPQEGAAMRKLTHSIWILVFIVALAQVIFVGQETLTVADDPRPVSEAIDILANKYGWLITYEDPPYRNSADIAPWLNVPKGARLDITYSLSTVTHLPDEAQVVSALLQTAQQKTGIVFEARKGAKRLHIVPARARDASGNLVDIVPILDTHITVTSEQTVAAGALSLICQELSRMTGEDVIVGTTPLGFLHIRTRVSANGIPAREVLSSLLDSIAPNLSWSLYYDPGDHSYALNIDVVHSKGERSATAK